MSVTKKQIRTFVAYARRAEKATTTWYRYLVGLASGILAILATFGKDDGDPFALWARRSTMILIALGILLGSLIIRDELRFARGHRDNYQAKLQSLISGGGTGGGASDVDPMPLKRTCEIACQIAMFLALVGLVLLAWKRAKP